MCKRSGSPSSVIRLAGDRRTPPSHAGGRKGRKARSGLVGAGVLSRPTWFTDCANTWFTHGGHKFLQNDLEGGRSPTGKSFCRPRFQILQPGISVNQIGLLECEDPLLYVDSAKAELTVKQTDTAGNLRRPDGNFLSPEGLAEIVPLTSPVEIARLLYQSRLPDFGINPVRNIVLVRSVAFIIMLRRRIQFQRVMGIGVKLKKLEVNIIYVVSW